MTATSSLPMHGRISLDQFLAFTGWTLIPGTNQQGMETALSFYQDRIPRTVLMKRVSSPGPYLLPRTGAVKLCELMQAIDFTRPVQRVMCGVNERFKCFRPKHEPKARRPKGNWFTHLSTAQSAVALPGEQDLARVYVVKRPVEALKSTVSDAFTWIRKSFEEIQSESFTDKYYKGGGTQFFIWNAEQHLELA